MSKALLDELTTLGLTDYGSEIPGALVHRVLGIVYPETAPKRVFDELALKELSAVDFVRNALLSQGKYLEGRRDGYRICLPSENRIYVERYMKSADKKLRRANRLSRNTPQSVSAPAPAGNVRLHLKQTSRRGFAGAIAA
uniref:hypothetical protein n=1 Tax=Comamonas testosteroni TaxID=285 RepID=UPI0015F83A0F|nr:hypothetical protein [Comamonas testosteroni]